MGRWVGLDPVWAVLRTGKAFAPVLGIEPQFIDRTSGSLVWTRTELPQGNQSESNLILQDNIYFRTPRAGFT
jgi:hypothetical protein